MNRFLAYFCAKLLRIRRKIAEFAGKIDCLIPSLRRADPGYVFYARRLIRKYCRLFLSITFRLLPYSIKFSQNPLIEYTEMAVDTYILKQKTRSLVGCVVTESNGMCKWNFKIFQNLKKNT